jgi:hypothetical protein
MPNVVCSRCGKNFPPSRMYGHVSTAHPEVGLPRQYVGWTAWHRTRSNATR